MNPAPVQASPGVRIQIAVFSDIGQLSDRADDWNELVAASAHPNVFLTWEWASQWWRSFGAGKQGHIITLSDECGRLMALCPLWRDKRGVIPGLKRRTLAFLGDGGPTYPEYLGPIIRADIVSSTVESLAEHILSEAPAWDMFRIPGAAPEDQATNVLIEALQRQAAVLRSPGPTCPYFALPESYEEFLGGLSRHGRQRERRLLRQAHKDFQVDCKLIQTKQELHAALPIIVDLSRSARARHGEASPFANSDYLAFHQGVMERLLPKGMLRLFILRFDGQAVAFQYGFLFADKYYDFQSGFDAGIDKHNPGDVLLQLIIQHLIGEGVREFDFLRGEHAYKWKFCKAARKTQSAIIFRRPGLLYFAWRARQALAAQWARIKTTKHS